MSGATTLYRVRLYRQGKEVCCKHFGTKERAHEQYDLLANEIDCGVRKKLLEAQPWRVSRTVQSPSEEKEPRKHNRTLTIEEFLEEYRSGELDTRERAFALSVVKQCDGSARIETIGADKCSAKAIFQALCHTDRYFDKTVTGLYDWNRENPPTDRVELDALEVRDEVVCSVAAFVQTAGPESKLH